MLLVKPRVPPIEQNGLPTGQIELTSAQAGGTQCPLPLREESAERCQYYGEALVGFGSNHPNLGFIMEFMSAVVCKTKYTNALTAKWIPLEVVDTAAEWTAEAQFMTGLGFTEGCVKMPEYLISRVTCKTVSVCGELRKEARAAKYGSAQQALNNQPGLSNSCT